MKEGRKEGIEGGGEEGKYTRTKVVIEIEGIYE